MRMTPRKSVIRRMILVVSAGSTVARFGKCPSNIGNDANVEVSQPYQPEPYREGSQSECDPVETAMGKQVPEGWLIAWLFTARIGPLTGWLLALFNQCFIDSHLVVLTERRNCAVGGGDDGRYL